MFYSCNEIIFRFWFYLNRQDNNVHGNSSITVELLFIACTYWSTLRLGNNIIFHYQFPAV